MRKHQRRVLLSVLLVGIVCLASAISLQAQPKPKRNVEDVSPQPSPSVQLGPYYALVIGNNDYRYLNKLITAANDADAVARMLRDRYGFHTQVLHNATRADILTALVTYRRSLPENSNLLIYYAGHGHKDRDADEAYWLPVDSQKDNNENWISADDITRDIRAIRSMHVLGLLDLSQYPTAFNSLEPESDIAILRMGASVGWGEHFRERAFHGGAAVGLDDGRARLDILIALELLKAVSMARLVLAGELGQMDHRALASRRL